MLIKWSKPNVNQIKQSKQNSQAQKKKPQKKTQTNELTFIQRKETCKLKNQKKKWIIQIPNYRWLIIGQSTVTERGSLLWRLTDDKQK